MRRVIGLLIAAVLCSPFAVANKSLPSVERKVVGDGQVVDIQPDLSKASRVGDGYVWTDRISVPGASFLKAHFVNVNLRAGDSIALINGHGRVVEQITGRGPKNRSTFWALSGQGDNLELRFTYGKPYPKAPFAVDRVIVGDQSLFAAPLDSGSRSICSPGDFEDAICYEGDTAKWNNVRASVGVMSVGGNAATALFCSGSNVAPTNKLLTNQHCVETQATCDNSEFVFEAYNTQCGVASPLSQWQSYRCDEVIAQEPFISCDAGPGDLDFTLATVIGDPAATYGHATADPTPLASGEDVYIVQHPAGRPHELTHGGGADVVIDGSVFRYFTTLDTEGGSSGSPIFRESDDKLVGLHHCGGCSDPAIGNRGMLMSEIHPLISEFLCQESLDLQAGAGANLTEVAGNGDAVVDPGETWSYTVSVRNNACAIGATGVSVDLAVGAGDAVLDTTSVNLGDIAAGASVTSVPITFTLPTDAACDATSVFDVTGISAGAGSFAGTAGNFSVLTGTRPLFIPFSESFDAGLAAWSIVDNGTGTGLAATWTIGNPGARSLTLTAPYSIVDSDELGTGQNMDEQMISPLIAATGFSALTLQYTHDFNHYNAGNNEQADVQIRSAATGGNWVTLVNYSGGDSSGTVQIDITSYMANDIQLRFHYYDATYEWWWAVDDIQVIGELPAMCNVFGETGGDSDEDGIEDTLDNCALVANPLQRDTDGDGYGNFCDPDLDNNNVVNALDLGLFKLVFFSADADADFDGNGVVNSIDLGILKSFFFLAPGPSGVAP